MSGKNEGRSDVWMVHDPLHVVHLEGVNHEHWWLLLTLMWIIAEDSWDSIHFKNEAVAGYNLVLFQGKAILITDELDILADIWVILI